MYLRTEKCARTIGCVQFPDFKRAVNATGMQSECKLAIVTGKVREGFLCWHIFLCELWLGTPWFTFRL